MLVPGGLVPSSPSIDHALRFGKYQEIMKVNSSVFPGNIVRRSHKEPVGSKLADFLSSRSPSSVKSSHKSNRESLQVKSAQDVRKVGFCGFSMAIEKSPLFSSLGSVISEEE